MPSPDPSGIGWRPDTAQLEIELGPDGIYGTTDDAVSFRPTQHLAQASSGHATCVRAAA